MQKIAPVSLSADVVAFSYGRMSPWLLNLDIKWPAFLARTVSYILNIIGLLQPLDIKLVCPLIVLRIKRI
jgi:hypothetical protein